MMGCIVGLIKYYSQHAAMFHGNAADVKVWHYVSKYNISLLMLMACNVPRKIITINLGINNRKINLILQLIA